MSVERVVVALGMRRALLTVVAAPALFLLPGCIAWEIRDEMRLANSNLACANAGIDQATRRIEQASTDIDGANGRMDAVSARLDLATERMSQTHENILTLRAVLLETNQRLTAVEGQLIKTQPMVGVANSRLEDLMVLREVHKTLLDINTTLGPLSKSMSSVGGVVSLLGLGGEPEPAPSTPAPLGADAVAAGDPAAAPAGPKDVAATANPAAPAAAGPGRGSNLLVGTWVLAYPVPDSATRQAPDQALVILAGGKYLLAVHGQPLVTGDWAQKDKTLTLTPTPPPAATPASSTPTPPNPPASPTPQPTTMEVLNNTLRALSVRIGDEVRVYTRP